MAVRAEERMRGGEKRWKGGEEERRGGETPAAIIPPNKSKISNERL